MIPIQAMVSSKASTSRRVLLTGENRGHNHRSDSDLRAVMKSHQKIENSTWRPETTINCRRRCALPALTLPLSASVAPPTARWSSGYTGHRGGREEKRRLARKGSRVCVSTMKLGRGCQGQEGQRDDLPEDRQSSVHTSPEWSQDKTRHVADMAVCRSPRKA